MKETIKVLVKHPHEHPEVRKIHNSLGTLQRFVGGSIETATFGDVVVICNEEGRIHGLEPNVAGFVGTIILAGVDGEDFTDVPGDRIEALRTLI